MQAMVLFCGKSSFDKELLCPLKRLAESPHVSVRRSLACGLHEVSSASWLNLNVGIIIDNYGVEALKLYDMKLVTLACLALLGRCI